MSACELVVDKHASVIGTTLYTDPKKPCLKSSGVYLQPKHQTNSPKVNVILWLHGWYVRSARNIFETGSFDMDPTLRQNVIHAEKDVVLVAPWLGHRNRDGGSLGLGSLGKGNGCQQYLEEILEALARYRKATAGVSPGPGTTPPPSPSTPPTPGQGAAGTGDTTKLEIGSLVIASHSGGGALMRGVVNALGDLKGRLKECWGFDCIYDRAWAGWARGMSDSGIKVYLYYAAGGDGPDAVSLWKDTMGTPKKPNPPGGRPVNLKLTPALKTYGTLIDSIAFQSVEQIQNKSSVDDHEKIRKEADVLLDSSSPSPYLNKIGPKLKGHFEVVRDLFGPRIKQSAAL